MLILSSKLAVRSLVIASSLLLFACGNGSVEETSNVPDDRSDETTSSPRDDGNTEKPRTAFGLSGGPNSYQTTRAAWKQLLDVSKEAGATMIHLQPMGWGETESVPGELNFSDFDEFLALRDEYGIDYTLDIGTPMGILKTDLPPDIEFKSFKDEEMIRRYKAYVAAMLTKFKNPAYVILHTETASTFLKDDDEAFDAYSDLLAETADYVRSISPTTKVGIYSTVDDSAEALESMGRKTDFFSFSYNANKGGDNHKKMLERLYASAGEKQIGIHEIGMPTAARVGGSEAAQVDFVNLIFDLAKERGNQLEFMAYYQAFDEDPAITSVWLPAIFPDWSAKMQEDGLAWFGSLGLHTFDSTPKPAWETFKKRIREY